MSDLRDDVRIRNLQTASPGPNGPENIRFQFFTMRLSSHIEPSDQDRGVGLLSTVLAMGRKPRKGMNRGDCRLLHLGWVKSFRNDEFVAMS